ncbi:MAG: phosphatidylserine decarboxylase [Planctomycetes bacterium]|nr:phosphatidylserine decarboxylase [Planctomycetota bacterium]
MHVRSLLLQALPKVALSRTTGLLTAIPLPRAWRRMAYSWFAHRYGADLDELAAPLDSFRSFAEFFARPLRQGARPIDPSDLVWPCDGRIVTAGPIEDGRIPQVKGQDYAVAELLADTAIATAFERGSQATIYLAPGDYHRVHAPFGGTLRSIRSIPGTLFPVNPPTVKAVGKLFVRNARKVFTFELATGELAIVVMVGALNVGRITASRAVGDTVALGDEIGRFGFGSTVVVLVGPGGPPIPTIAPETVVRTGRAIG